MDRKKAKFYLTTAIDYVNAAPHIGHALEKVQADALARFRRAEGRQVRFLTGADEHGTKIARAAEAAGKNPQEFTDGTSAKFADLKRAFDLSWDEFIRTTDRKRHWPAVRAVWEKLAAQGDIYKKSYKGLYCVGHEAFVTAKDLVDGKCADHGKAPETVEEENYFFKLSKYGGEIKKRIEAGELEIIPASRKNEILSLISQGLEDVSFSRPRKDLSWGIPVPGDESQTIYVWADALTNYLSGAGYPDENFAEWWPADAHCIGKDILRFHAAIWPGMLISLGLPLPKRILVHGFITVEGQKMSKTLGNVIDPFALASKYGTDAVRYYLLREIPSTEDGDFGEAKFRGRYNGDLANGLGNFAARVLALAAKESGIGGDALDKSSAFEPEIRRANEEVARKVDEFKLHEALAEIWALIAAGDRYLNEKEVWKIKDEAPRREALADLLCLLENIAAMLAPFLPGTSQKILSCIVRKGSVLEVKKGETLFPRLA